MSLHLNDFKPTDASLEAALAPPETARTFVNPVEDDTWVRHADLVRMEQLRSAFSADDVAAKRALLQEYAHLPRHTTAQAAARASNSPDALALTTASGTSAAATSEEFAIMEGMAWQERFLEEYKRQNANEDKDKAMSYKQKMMENFRKKHAAKS